MRDAVDYVVGRARGADALTSPVRACDARPSSDLGPSASPIADPSLLRRRWPTGRGAPSTPATPSNERLEFLGDAVLGWVVADHIFRALRRPARGRADQARARAWSTPPRWPRWPTSSTSATSAARQGRGRAGRPREAVDPGRRPGGGIGAVYLDGGSRRAARARAAAARRPHRRRRRPPRRRSTTRRRCRSWPPAASTRRPCYDVRERGARPRQAFFATVLVGGEVARRRARAGRRSRPSRRRPREACATARPSRRPPMPELPEVETDHGLSCPRSRRSAASSSGRSSASDQGGEVTGTRRRAPDRRRRSARLDGRQGHGGRPRASTSSATLDTGDAPGDRTCG